MSAVRQRIEAMGGRIEVRSQLGKGTTWTFEVPLRAGNVPLQRVAS